MNAGTRGNTDAGNTTDEGTDTTGQQQLRHDKGDERGNGGGNASLQI